MVGYDRLLHDLIFRDRAVLFDNAIVLVMEMDRDKVETASALRTGEAALETYHYLGEVRPVLRGTPRLFRVHQGLPLPRSGLRRGQSDSVGVG
jgi:hypothetical protein